MTWRERMEKKVKTISEQIQEIAEDFCNNYCKWPHDYNEDEHDGVELSDSEICTNCPIGRL